MLYRANLTFPRLRDPQIERDNLVDSLDALLAENEIVEVGGPDGIGKTTLLTQCVLRHPDTAISIFVEGRNRYQYEPDRIRAALRSQLSLALWGRMRDGPAFSEIGRLFTRLEERAQASDKIFELVVDGLTEIEDVDRVYRDAIMDLIPLGAPRIKVVFSGPIRRIFRDRLANLTIGQFAVPPLSKAQTGEFLRDLSLEKEQLEFVFANTRGRPDHLRHVRTKIIEGEIKAEDVTQDIFKLFELDWATISKDDDLKAMLAMVLFGPQTDSIDKLSDMLGTTEGEIRARLSRAPFLQVDESGSITWMSGQCQSYYEGKLSGHREMVSKLVLEDLFSREPNSDIVVTYLPDYLEGAGQDERLLSFLSPSFFLSALQREGSLEWAKKMSIKAAEAAFRAGRHDDVLRFVLQRLAFDTAEGLDLVRAEVEAHVECGDQDFAFELVETVRSKVDQLFILTLLARLQHKHGLAIQSTVTDRIRRLYAQLDISSVGDERGERLLSVLMPILPDLAVDLVSRLESNARSMARSNLTSALPPDVSGTGPDTEDLLLRLARAVGNVLATFRPEEAVAEFGRITESAQRISLLAHWLESNVGLTGAAMVSEHTLGIMTSDSSYIPTAADIRRVALGLRSLDRPLDKKKLTDMIHRFLPSARLTGPTQEYILVLGEIAAATASWSSEDALSVAQEAVRSVEAIADPVVRVTSAAKLMESLSHISQADKLLDMLRDSVLSDVIQIVEGTADHVRALQGALQGLALADWKLALEVADVLNTEPRRQEARYVIAKELIESTITMSTERASNLEHAYEVQEQITDMTFRARLLHEMVTRWNEDSYEGENAIAASERWISLIPGDAPGPAEACISYSSAIRFLLVSGRRFDDESVSRLCSLVDDTFTRVDSLWEQTNLAFGIASRVGQVAPVLGDKYLRLGKTFRDDLSQQVHGITAFTTVLSLAIRAFGGLREGVSESDLTQMEQLISSVPDPESRLLLWRDLAAEARRIGEDTIARTIVERHIQPSISPQPNSYHERRWYNAVVPLLYHVHSARVLDAIDRRDEADTLAKERSLQFIMEFILFEVLPGHDLSTRELSDRVAKISFEDLENALAVVRHISWDYLIHLFIHEVGEAASRGHITRPQKYSLAQTIRGFLPRLPNPRYIAHNGYKIVVEAEAVRLESVGGVGEWRRLLSAADSVTNVSDRVYIYILVARLLRDPDERKRILVKAQEALGEIIDILERAERREELAEVLYKVDRTSAQQLLKDGFSEASGDTIQRREDRYAVQRRMIDTAYRLNPEFGNAIARLADDDPARVYGKRKAEEAKVVDQVARGDSLASPPRQGVLGAACAVLLNALEAGRPSTVDVRRASRYLLYELGDLDDAYPVLSWYIENAKRRHTTANAVVDFVRPLFRATIYVAELLLQMNRSRSSIETLEAVPTIVGKQSLFRDGERHLAIAYIEEWLRKHLGNWIIITDRFFGPGDVEALARIMSVNPSCEVTILTGDRPEQTFEEWNEAWQRIAMHTPPTTEVVVVSDTRNKSPFHDRWWITESAALWFGTSYNGFGLSLTKIGEVLPEERHELELNQRLFSERQVWEWNGRSLKYRAFRLGPQSRRHQKSP